MELAAILRLLAHSATGQDMSVYTTFTTGPKRPGDLDGPEAFHVLLLDNGRTTMLGNEFREMLRCIRCGACINHCPIYSAVGPCLRLGLFRPMGAVLIPNLIGIEEAGHLPNASTLCGRCEEVCPMRIPLPRMLRQLRDRQFEAKLSPKTIRWGLSGWAFMARRPKLSFDARRAWARWVCSGEKRQFRRHLPLASGWTAARDLAAPPGKTFQQMWSAKGGRRA